MKAPPEVQSWLEAQGLGPVVSLEPVAGGCIHNGARLGVQQGDTFFLKQNAAVPADLFPKEAHGLEALAVPGGPRLPRPLLVGANFLLLEDLQPGPRRAGYWEALGEQLAVLHATVSDTFGFEHDNYLGSTPQPNPKLVDGHAFFAEHRLRFQGRLALDQGLLEPDDFDCLERILERLPGLIPAQPASLLHGDLWSGNVSSGPTGAPAIIDPAAHYGWAEAELGMTALFGGFPEPFYASYEASAELAPGWRSRLSLYNLYHLLNHLNLFGRSYLSQVQSTLRRWS